MTTITDIWNNYGKQLSEFICKKTNHQEYCNDVLQDVYLKIIHNIEKVNKARNIKSYLLKIADNTVIDFYRAKAAKPVANADFVDSMEAVEIEEEDTSLQLADCCLRPMIESLEPIYREALILTELEGLAQKQFADKVGITHSGALPSARLGRGRRPVPAGARRRGTSCAEARRHGAARACRRRPPPASACRA